jgi:hypothetical protein
VAWIKFEKDLLTDPRVLRIAKTLEQRFNLGEPEGQWPEGALAGPCNAASLPAVTLVCGALVRIWCLADTHVGADDVLPLGLGELNEHIGIPGFCELLPVDWLISIDEEAVKLPDFHAHNGTEAKKKAVTQKRVERHRTRALHARNASALPDHTKTIPDQTKTRPLKPIASSAKARSAGVNGDAVAYMPLNDGTEWGVSKEFAAELEKLFPAVNVLQTLNEIRAWNIANPQRRKTSRGIKHHVTQWMAREQNRGPKN